MVTRLNYKSKKSLEYFFNKYGYKTFQTYNDGLHVKRLRNLYESGYLEKVVGIQGDCRKRVKHKKTNYYKYVWKIRNF